MLIASCNYNVLSLTNMKTFLQLHAMLCHLVINSAYTMVFFLEIMLFAFIINEN